MEFSQTGLWILEGGKCHCSNKVGLVNRPTIFDPNQGGATDSELPKDQIGATRRKLVVVANTTKEELLRSEDTDGDGLITVDDRGPKVCLILSR